MKCSSSIIPWKKHNLSVYNKSKAHFASLLSVSVFWKSSAVRRMGTLWRGGVGVVRGSGGMLPKMLFEYSVCLIHSRKTNLWSCKSINRGFLKTIFHFWISGAPSWNVTCYGCSARPLSLSNIVLDITVFKEHFVRNLLKQWRFPLTEIVLYLHLMGQLIGN